MHIWKKTGHSMNEKKSISFSLDFIIWHHFIISIVHACATALFLFVTDGIRVRTSDPAVISHKARRQSDSRCASPHVCKKNALLCFHVSSQQPISEHGCWCMLEYTLDRAIQMRPAALPTRSPYLASFSPLSSLHLLLYSSLPPSLSPSVFLPLTFSSFDHVFFLSY